MNVEDLKGKIIVPIYPLTLKDIQKGPKIRGRKGLQGSVNRMLYFTVCILGEEYPAASLLQLFDDPKDQKDRGRKFSQIVARDLSLWKVADRGL